MHEERIKILQPSLSISSTSWGEACMILHQASKDTVLAIFSCYENGEYSKTGWNKIFEKNHRIIFERNPITEESEDLEMLKKMVEIIQEPTWDTTKMHRSLSEHITLHYCLPVRRCLEALKTASVSIETKDLRKGDVISSQVLEKVGALLCLPKLGYGNNAWNRGECSEEQLLPHIKHHVWLRLCAISSGYKLYSLFHGNNETCPIKSAECEFAPLLSFECFVQCENENDAVKVGHIDLRLSAQTVFSLPLGNTYVQKNFSSGTEWLLEEGLEINGVWFDKNTIGHAEYLRAISGWENNKGFGLAALNTLFIFLERTPQLFPHLKKYFLEDLSSINGEKTWDILYPKLGFITFSMEYSKKELEEQIRKLPEEYQIHIMQYCGWDSKVATLLDKLALDNHEKNLQEKIAFAKLPYDKTLFGSREHYDEIQGNIYSCLAERPRFISLSK